MPDKSFKEKIEAALKSLTPKQQVKFAYRCALRALPYLANEGDFSYWSEIVRQHHLFRVFLAIEYSADAAGADAAGVAANVARAADDARFNDAARSAAYTTAFAARSAAYSARTSASDAAYIALNATEAINRCEHNKANEVEAIFLQDIEDIKTNRSTTATTIFDDAWLRFQHALEKEGCDYWGKLFKSIVDNGFIVDQRAFKRRLIVPEEIKNQGAAAVANYLELLEIHGAKKLNESRILILGEKGAGKTCIARRLVDLDATMATVNDSTAGVDTSIWPLLQDDINIRIWDFAGHTVTHAVHQFFLSERCLYILVYDGRSESRNRLEYWLDHMKNYGGNSQAVILVNVRDQHKVDIPINSLRDKYSIHSVHHFSIQDDRDELCAFRNEIASLMSENPCWSNQEIPADYYQVKSDLEKLFDKKTTGKEHISKIEFEEIAATHGIEDSEQLLKDLNALGVSLWYEELAGYDTLVLNPEWISHGVYKIINWVANSKSKYTINLDEFRQVFKDETRQRFCTEHHGFFFDLMKHFELAYETQGSEALVISHLLPKDRPEQLPEFPLGEGLMLKYVAETPLPPHTISRFIVRHHKLIQSVDGKQQVWREGVVLIDGDNQALIREDDRTISIAVKGPNKTEFISRLRDSMDDIFNSYKSDKPELLYRIEMHGRIDDPLWLTDEKITNHVNAERPYFEDVTQQDIDLRPTCKQFNINARNFVLNGNIQDNSQTINIKELSAVMQSDLSELAQYLKEDGKENEAKALENTAKALEQADPEQLKTNGVGKRVKRFLDDLGDKNSSMRKAIEGTQYGAGVVKDIAENYNKIADLTGLPQVPKILL